MVAAIAIVMTGTKLLQETSRFGSGRAHLYGGLVLLAGALLFGALARQPHVPEMPSRSRIRLDTWMATWTILALIAAAYAMFRFVKTQEDRIVDVAWLASVLAMFVGQWHSRTRDEPRPRGKVQTAVMILLLAAALASRLYHLGTLPFNLDGDYADFGLQARDIALGETKQLFAFGWAAIPLMGYMPAALTMKIAGTGLVGLYLAGVIEGLLAIVAVYLLGSDLFGRRAGVLAAALMTISYTHLHFSRTCAYIDPVFFTTWGLYFLVRALRHGSGLAAVASGTLIALDLEMYYAGRAIVFLAAIAVLLVVLRSRQWLSARLREVALVVVAVVVVLGPMLYLFERNHDAFVSRSRDVLIFTPPVVQHMKSVYGVTSVAAMLAQQAQRAALLFWTYTDTSTQFGARRAFLDSFSATALALGIGYALFTLRRLGSALSLGWLLIILLLGCFLTVNPPFFPRLAMLVAPAALLGAVALDRLYDSVGALLSRRSRFLGWFVPGVALTVAFTLTGLANWTWYEKSFKSWATAGAHLARYLASHPSLRAYSVAVPSWWARTREFSFLAPGQLLGDLSPEEVAHGEFDPSATLIFSPDRGPLVESLRVRYPDAVVEAHPGNSPGEVAFFVFRRS
jgi:4-amino-4-deoxy-L-arabinose transferase-like glycosyltransferase